MTGQILSFLHHHNRASLLIAGAVVAVVLWNWIF